MNNFVSLHLNSEYSILQSTIKIDSLINFALENNLTAIALTDHNVMSGVAEFVNKCHKNNIRPIVGLDLDVEDYRLILLARNYNGYKHLAKLSSRKMHNHNISLVEIDAKDIFIIDHPTYGYYIKHQKNLDIENFYIGTTKNIKEPNAVFVNDTRILKSVQENEILQILKQISNNNKEQKTFDLLPYPLVVDKKDPKVQLVFKIASLCDVDFTESKMTLPEFPTPQNIDQFTYLKNIVMENSAKILEKCVNKNLYETRINYELSIIKKLGFANYFLIIYDIVAFSKKQKIIVGPGRGSVAGSLIAYILNITEIDPLQFGLLFERFLNPERVNMPDIDLDFQDNRRDEVIDYIFNKYGLNNVALISTFQRLGPKMALRDLGRNLGFRSSEIDVITKTIPNLINVPYINSLDGIYDNVSQFRALINKDKKTIDLFKKAKLIEGLPRQQATHAAGIVINKTVLNDEIPTLLGANNYNQIQFPMDYLEEQGLLKIDILGLRNLTILQNIQTEIQENHHHRINLKSIPLHDKLTNQLLSNGDTNGIFQLESYGMRKTLAKVVINSVDDVTAVISLYRPGPMDNIPLYIEGKKHQTFKKIDPSIDMILETTYGIIVYQEQIMQVVQSFSGMNFGQADIFRRAIGKKDSKLLASLQQQFVKMSLQKGHSDALIKEVYDYIAKFANFGFNKSHAVAYAVLAYRLAYLKAHFPLEFYTALINASLGSIEAIKTYINEIKSKGITVIGPNINSSKTVTYNKDQKIILPFTIIKGIGLGANEKIIEARNNVKFKNIFEVVTRLKFFGIGEKTIELLIKANAFRDFENMATCLASSSALNRYASMVIVKRNHQKQIDYSIITKPQLVAKERDLDKEVKNELAALGMQINAFLTLPFEKETKLFNLPFDKETQLVVLFEKSYQFKTKTGEMMGNIVCSDSSQSVDISIFPNLWKNFHKSLISKLFTIVVVKIKKDNLTQLNLVKLWKEINPHA